MGWEFKIKEYQVKVESVSGSVRMKSKNISFSIFCGIFLCSSVYGQKTVETNIPYALHGQNIFYNSLFMNQANFAADSWSCSSVQNNLNYSFFGMGLTPSNGFSSPSFDSIYGGSCAGLAQNFNIPVTSGIGLAKPIGEKDVPMMPPRNLADIKNDLSKSKFSTKGVDPNIFNPNIVNSYVSGDQNRICTNNDPELVTSPGGGEVSPPRLRSGDRPLNEEDRIALTSDLGPQPRFQQGGRLQNRVRIPNPGDEFRTAGYQLYSDGSHDYGVDRTIWNIRAAGRILAEKKIVMGVGHISPRTGGTTSHTEHQGGKDVDLRLVPPRDGSGYAVSRPCTTSQSNCFDVDNTFEMIKAFIDVDPYGIDRVYVNSRALREKVNTYLRDTYGISYDPSKEGLNSPRGNPNISTACPGHADHVHISFKNNSTPTPDELMERARVRE